MEKNLNTKYYPKYVEKFFNNICERCNNKLCVETIKDYSYLSECEKCTNSSMYNYYNINDIPPEHYLDFCKCKTINIYKKIIKCSNCIICNNCNKNIEINILNKLNINDKHLCNTCIKKNNSVSENINY